MMSHEELKQRALSRPEVKAEYDALGPEFELLRQLLRARKAAGLTQADVADRMGTQPPSVARLESALTSGSHSPSMETLKRYAAAVGCRIQIKLVRSKQENGE